MDPGTERQAPLPWGILNLRTRHDTHPNRIPDRDLSRFAACGRLRRDARTRFR